MTELTNISPAAPIAVVCVRNGPAYSWEDVLRLRRAVAAHLPVTHSFFCLTDSDHCFPASDPRARGLDLDVIPNNLSSLRGWWMKMAIFRPWMRRLGTLIYFDLDTVVRGSLIPIAAAATRHPFTICGSFTRAAGNPLWPCRYGSCVMTVRPDFPDDLWEWFWIGMDRIVATSRYGDQQAIERAIPDAPLLQDLLPPRYFLNYRNLSAAPPPSPDGAVIIFGGRNKPGNSPYRWVQDAWAGGTGRVA